MPNFFYFIYIFYNVFLKQAEANVFLLLLFIYIINTYTGFIFLFRQRFHFITSSQFEISLLRGTNENQVLSFQMWDDNLLIKLALLMGSSLSFYKFFDDCVGR